jgi:hypothetical protein
MRCRSAIVLLALLTGLSSLNAANKTETASLRLSSLPPGQVLRIETENRVYRVELTDGRTGEARVAVSSDGESFAEPQRMFILGATQGEQPDSGGLTLVLAGQVKEGMRLELSRGSADSPERFVSTPIRSIQRLAAER